MSPTLLISVVVRFVVSLSSRARCTLFVVNVSVIVVVSTPSPRLFPPHSPARSTAARAATAVVALLPSSTPSVA